MKPIERLHKQFVLQHDQSDCGVACVRNILLYYGAEISLEKLREWSGTTSEGTSLLGLQEAGAQAGFIAQGAQAENIYNLKEVQDPCILHVVKDESVLHYVVYYPDNSSDRFLVGDPATGISHFSADELNRIWISKAALLLQPTDKLQRWQRQQEKKRKWFLQTIKEDAHLLYIAVALGLVAAALNLSTAIFSQKLIDDILPNSDRQRLFAGLGLLAILLVIKSLFTYVRQLMLIRQSFQFNTRITGGFYKSVLYLTKSFFDNRKTGDLIARLNDTIRIQQAISYVFGEMAIQAMIFIVSLVFIFIYSWTIGLFCLLIFPVVAMVVKYFHNDIALQQQRVMVAHAHNESNYIESIKGISTIKVMNRENMFINVARNIFGLYQGSIFRLGKVKNNFTIALEITVAVLLLTVITWCSVAVLNKNLNPGEMIAILQMATLLMQTSVLVALTNVQIQEARVAADRMYEFTSAEPEYNPDKIPASAVVSIQDIDRLRVEHLGFRFPGKKQLLRDISFEVGRGEIIALTGESGQGKSTILQILQKFYLPENGTITVDDHDFSEIAQVFWRNVIGVVPQDITAFSGSLAANICLTTDTINQEQVEQFCAAYGFDKYFTQFPQGYETMLGEGGVSLSGGQKQLLALARCLYSSPSLLLLDEPTSAMDANTERFVIDLLQKVKNSAAILIISHKDSLTQVADRIYSIRSGITSGIVNRVERETAVV